VPLRTSSRGVSLLAVPLFLRTLLFGGLGATVLASGATAATAVVNVDPPWVGGGAKATATLTAHPGTWSPASGVTYTYQWLESGNPIGGATNSEYSIPVLSAGGRFSVQVTASAPGLTSTTLTSLATGPAGGLLSAPTYENRGRPLIVGSPVVGATLTASNGHWSTPATGFAYQWSAGGAAIAGATQQTFVPTAAELGKAITITVTASASGATATGTSLATAAVTGDSINNVSVPSIAVSGAPKVGDVLSADPGTWSVTGTSYAYQWLADGAAISGATTSSFTPTDAQVGKRLSVRVTATRSGYAQGQAESASTAPVEAAVPGITVTNGPTLVGQPRIGKILLARAGTFTPSDATVTYQWLRAGSPIAGATASKFALTMSDLGKTITVRATYARAGLASAVRTSPPTSPVKSTPQFRIQHSQGSGPVKLTVVVTAPAVSRVSGTILLTEKGHKLGQRALSNGRVAFTLRGLSTGRHTLKVSLSGGDDVADGSKTTSFKVG
jgi:hypothetical protein